MPNILFSSCSSHNVTPPEHQRKNKGQHSMVMLHTWDGSMMSHTWDRSATSHTWDGSMMLHTWDGSATSHTWVGSMLHTWDRNATSHTWVGSMTLHTWDRSATSHTWVGSMTLHTWDRSATSHTWNGSTPLKFMHVTYCSPPHPSWDLGPHQYCSETTLNKSNKWTMSGKVWGMIDIECCTQNCQCITKANQINYYG